MSLDLFYRSSGNGQPLIILHGLFGLNDNWQSFSKQITENDIAVYAVDLRNHGSSPHDPVFDYDSMADDIFAFIRTHDLKDINIMGHSLGGKVAMKFALEHQEILKSLIVVDIAPRYYAPHHQQIIKALQAVDLDTVNTRKEAEHILSGYIDDAGVKMFLLKNLYWEGDRLQWRFNLKVIAEKIESVGQRITSTEKFEGKTLFIKGEKSKYITDDDKQEILSLFPHAEIKTCAHAGHWVHADNPECMLTTVRDFLSQ